MCLGNKPGHWWPLYKHIVCVSYSVPCQKVRLGELAEAPGGKIKRELPPGKLLKSKVGVRWEGTPVLGFSPLLPLSSCIILGKLINVVLDFLPLR